MTIHPFPSSRMLPLYNNLINLFFYNPVLENFMYQRKIYNINHDEFYL